MKVLWFSPTPSLYEQKARGHNGGGWIFALESRLCGVEDFELAVAFEYGADRECSVIDGTTYFPIYVKAGLFASRESITVLRLRKALDIIEQFEPDVIQIFGSEWWYGLLVDHTNIPIIIHMQGSLPSYYNARYPVGISTWDRVLSAKTSLVQKIMAHRGDRTFKYNALREERIIQSNKYFLGRTHWDRAIIELYNPQARYFECQEMIRDSFVNSQTHWSYRNDGRISIISTISGPLYKGVDVILKTARLLKEFARIDFEWNICGVSDSDFIESCYGIRAADVNVNYLGVVTVDELKERLLESTIYVHPSYIDNSPNSVCEAQLLGVPLIATNVGGLATIVDDGVTGYLVPANDPVMLASMIIDKTIEAELIKVSQNERRVASKRHNPQTIIDTVLSVYGELINLKDVKHEDSSGYTSKCV